MACRQVVLAIDTEPWHNWELKKILGFCTASSKKDVVPEAKVGQIGWRQDPPACQSVGIPPGLELEPF